MPVEWEWLDLAQTAMFLEGDPTWRIRGRGHLTDQNAARVTGAVVVSVLGKWLHDAWVGAVVATWVAWCACTWAIVRLVRQASWVGSGGHGARAAGIASVVLTVTATGFLGFVGAIDVHVLGYAGVALGLLLLLRWVARPEDRSALPARARSSLVGAALFILDGTLQLGAPLIVFASCVILWRGARLSSDRRRRVVREFGQALAVFAAMALAWIIVSRVGSDGSFEVHNEAIARARESLGNLFGLLSTFRFDAMGVLSIALGLFRWWLVVAACVGWVVASSETKFWTLAWVGLVIGATVLTRYTASTVYLMFPAVYVLASVCAGFLVDTSLRLLPVGVSSGRGAWGVAAIGGAVISLVPALTQLAFLWGDYTMPAVWWPGP